MNAGNKSVISKARDIQQRIDSRIKKIKPLSEFEYFFMVTMGLLLTGMMLFVYQLINNIRFNNLTLLSDPLFYFGLGFCCFVCTIYFLKFKV